MKMEVAQLLLTESGPREGIWLTLPRSLNDTLSYWLELQTASID